MEFLFDGTYSIVFFDIYQRNFILAPIARRILSRRLICWLNIFSAVMVASWLHPVTSSSFLKFTFELSQFAICKYIVNLAICRFNCLCNHTLISVDPNQNIKSILKSYLIVNTQHVFMTSVLRLRDSVFGQIVIHRRRVKSTTTFSIWVLRTGSIWKYLCPNTIVYFG